MVAGQDISSSKIVWEAEQATDLQTNSTTPMSCQFISNGRQSVEWIQKKGMIRTIYTVTSVEGNWQDIRTNGSVTYQLERNGKHCKMVFERNDAGTYATMIFVEGSNTVSQLRFNIKSVK